MNLPNLLFAAGAVLAGVALWTTPANALVFGSVSGTYVDLGVGEAGPTQRFTHGGANQAETPFVSATSLGGAAQASGFAQLAGASLGATAFTTALPRGRTEALATAMLWDRIDLLFPTDGPNDFSFILTLEGEETKPTPSAVALGRARWLFTKDMNYNPAGQPYLASGGGLQTVIVPMRHVGKSLSLYTYLELQTQARTGGVADFGDTLRLNWDLPPGTILSSHSGKLSEAVGGVPEPGAWALMILGFGGAGAMLRRSRAARATAPA